VDDVDATCGLLWVGFWTLLVDNVSVEVRAEAMAKAIFDSWGDETVNKVGIIKTPNHPM
jgi:hypothetical protein